MYDRQKIANRYHTNKVRLAKKYINRFCQVREVPISRASCPYDKNYLGGRVKDLYNSSGDAWTGCYSNHIQTRTDCLHFGLICLFRILVEVFA